MDWKFLIMKCQPLKREERGKNLGRFITRQLESFAKNRSVNCIYLLTTTAKDFFTKEGYIEVDRNNVPGQIQNTSEFSSVCPTTAVVMKKIMQRKKGYFLFVLKTATGAR